MPSRNFKQISSPSRRRHWVRTVTRVLCIDAGFAFDVKSRSESLQTPLNRSHSRPSGEWIIALRATHSAWPEQTLPTRAELDQIPNPVILQHLTGHVRVVNS
jgi:predicted amidohydrolase YtcJ